MTTYFLIGIIVTIIESLVNLKALIEYFDSTIYTLLGTLLGILILISLWPLGIPVFVYYCIRKFRKEEC